MVYDISLVDTVQGGAYELPIFRETVVGRSDPDKDDSNYLNSDYAQGRGRVAIECPMNENYNRIWKEISMGHVHIYRYDLEGVVTIDFSDDFELGGITQIPKETLRSDYSLFTVVDKRSKNGTFLNGEPVSKNQERFIQDGAILNLGRYELIFRVLQRLEV